MFVNNEDLNQIIEIDPNGLKVRSRWPIAPCKEPSGMAIDVAHKRLFSGCHNGITTARTIALVRSSLHFQSVKA